MTFPETSLDQAPGTAASKGDFGLKASTSSVPAAKTSSDGMGQRAQRTVAAQERMEKQLPCEFILDDGS
eukprot:1295907-Heterocapsa_arctica.AAC.1